MAWELGLFEVTLHTLNTIVTMFDSEQLLNLDEPFLPVSARFDHIDPVGNTGGWCLASILELLEKVQANSSYHTGKASLDNLQMLKELGFLGAEMERRRQLIKMRYVIQDSPELSGILRQETTDNLNPDLWTAQKIPGGSSMPLQEELKIHIGGEKPKAGWKILNIQDGPHLIFLVTAKT